MKKLTNKKGFTLMEMIIVIAIIVILAAISIPTLTANLDSAKKATDEANLRAAKSAALVYAMDSSVTVASGDTRYYNVTTGKVEAVPATLPKDGECTNHANAYILITYGANEEVTSVQWAGATSGYEDSCK